MIKYVVYQFEFDRTSGEYQILTIDEAYRWIQSGSTNILRIKDSLTDINIPEIKRKLENERVLDLLNSHGQHWIITKISI